MTSKKVVKTEKEESNETESLKDTDTLPSETETASTSSVPEEKKEEKPAPKKKIIGLMGYEHQEGPPGSTHG